METDGLHGWHRGKQTYSRCLGLGVKELCWLLHGVTLGTLSAPSKLVVTLVAIRIRSDDVCVSLRIQPDDESYVLSLVPGTQ